MTDPNRFERASRLLVALRKLADRERDAVAKVEARYAERRSGMLEAASPDVRELVLTELGESDGS